jgi:hypothetical protein
MKAFLCKRIKEHKQERINTQSEIAYVYEAKMNMEKERINTQSEIVDVYEAKINMEFKV